jgi:hypothetical protein
MESYSEKPPLKVRYCFGSGESSLNRKLPEIVGEAQGEVDGESCCRFVAIPMSGAKHFQTLRVL